MLELELIDVEQLAIALADQTDYEHRWLIDPRNGELIFWTSDTGIDGHHPVELDDLDPVLVHIHPLPPHVWYQDMADFAAGIADPQIAERLVSAIQGRGAFRRFKSELYGKHPELISEWHSFRDARAHRRAVEWLVDNEIVAPPPDGDSE